MSSTLAALSNMVLRPSFSPAQPTLAAPDAVRPCLSRLRLARHLGGCRRVVYLYMPLGVARHHPEPQAAEVRLPQEQQCVFAVLYGVGAADPHRLSIRFHFPRSEAESLGREGGGYGVFRLGRLTC